MVKRPCPAPTPRKKMRVRSPAWRIATCGWRRTLTTTAAARRNSTPAPPRRRRRRSSASCCPWSTISSRPWQATPPRIVDQLRAGVGLIADQITQLLRQHGITPEESLHTSFDPHRHEARGVLTDPSQPDQTILEVYRRGYRRGDEVFRPAQVVVNELNSPPAA